MSESNNPQVVGNNPNMILWCNLCNQRPSDGILEVLFDGNIAPTKLQACEICVMTIPDEGWIIPESLPKEPVMNLDDFKVFPDE